jgi:hypothetical protein
MTYNRLMTPPSSRRLQMSGIKSISQRHASQPLLGIFSLTIGGIGLAKFLGLMFVYGPAQSPWFFLLLFVVPFLIGWRLLRSRPRGGAVVIGVFAAALVALCVVAVVTGIEPYWADYVLVFVGGPFALAAVGLAVRVWSTNPQR